MHEDGRMGPVGDSQQGFKFDSLVWKPASSVRGTSTRRSWVLNAAVVPMMYAYSATIHYVQGKTLRCKVVLGLLDCFEWGQAYVGVSRVTDFKNLRIIGIDQGWTAHRLNLSVFRCHPKVLEFYAALVDDKVVEIE